MYESEVEHQEQQAADQKPSFVPDAAAEHRGWRWWSLRAGSAVTIPILLLVAAEICLRAFNIGYSTDLTQPCTLHGQPAACYNLFFPAPFFPPGMIKTPEAYAVPADKPAGTFRIFVLGESAAMGDPDPAYAFSRYLEMMLRQQFPQMKFEVINTGSVAINSHVLLPIAKSLAKQRPDVFIIYSGNNEVVGPYGPGTALTSSAMSLPVIRANIFLRSTRIGQLLTRIGSQKREWGGMEMFLDKQVPASSPLMKNTYANFEANLRDTVAAARKSGAQVIVSTVATNLRDCAPFASQHRADLSQDDLRQWNALVQQASELDDARSYDQAMKLYAAALAIDDQYAELEFRIAGTLWKMGNYPDADQHFERARDLDTLRFRADSRINDINRSVASSTSGVNLVDAAALLSQQSPNGIVGSDLIYEHVHLTPLGNYLLARAMFQSIASRIAGRPVAQSDAASQAECDRLLAFTSYDHSRIANEMLQRLQRPPFTNQLNHSEQMFRMMVNAQPPAETPDQTEAEYRWALSQSPNDRILRYAHGLFLFNFDRQAAVDELRLSQPWDGFPVFTPDGTQIQ
jgi:tetratricopeptide (TPR) repeat protein